jgi:leader peptidase (prepilin peptidase)/N-methyltransferase
VFAYLASRPPIVRVLVAAITVATLAVLWWAAGRDAGETIGRARLLCFAGYATFALTLLVVALIDLATAQIPDVITLPGALVFYGLSFTRPGTRWYDGLVGAIVGYAVPLAIRAYRRLKGGPEPLGLGVVKLLGAIGAYLGWRGALATLFGGSVVGMVAMGVAVARQVEDGAEPLPREVEFAPYLAIAAVGYIVLAPWLRTVL